jgi:Asp-tRNA(Asn)/Glu-tRNA(Gln) amidotransferase A subunit family amidase
MKDIGRRRFIRRVPAALAAGAMGLSQVRSSAASGQQGARPGPGKDALKCAEQLVGLQFTDAEEEMAALAASRNLDSYQALRQLDIPLDTEPAITFRPYLPGKRPRGEATRNARIAVTGAAHVRVTSRLEELAFEPVTVLSALIENRSITSIDLTTMYLARLKRYGDRLHCVVTLTEELALAQAARADRELKGGRHRGPLHGIPWGAKDLFATKGIRTTWGAKPYEHQVPAVDATVVERLRNAGAVLVAKLSMGSLAQGGVWFGGTTRNPWAPETGSSGSSAGPGAATAAGLVGFALGTETRGSIITPASICGVVGLRPTYGRVSRYGAMALSWTMDKIGPICRSVEDCAIALNAIYGSDGRDETVVDAPFVWNPTVPLSTLRIGYVARELEGGLLKDALDVLRARGAKLEPMELPDFPTDAINFILSAEAAAAFDDLTRSKGIDELTEQGAAAWPNTFRTSRFIPAVEYIRAQRARTLLGRKMDALMSTYDVFLSPARGSASLPITNLTGHPALCLTAGFVDDLPQALMITGRLYDEATVLRVALAYERATKWHTRHPDMNRVIG